MNKPKRRYFKELGKNSRGMYVTDADMVYGRWYGQLKHGADFYEYELKESDHKNLANKRKFKELTEVDLFEEFL